MISRPISSTTCAWLVRDFRAETSISREPLLKSASPQASAASSCNEKRHDSLLHNNKPEEQVADEVLGHYIGRWSRQRTSRASPRPNTLLPLAGQAGETNKSYYMTFNKRRPFRLNPRPPVFTRSMARSSPREAGKNILLPPFPLSKSHISTARRGRASNAGFLL